MKLQRKIFLLRIRKSQAGLTVMETVIALAMLVIVATGVMGLAAVAVSTTETQGHLAARTAEYAQDKMEQLARAGRTPQSFRPLLGLGQDSVAAAT